MSKRDELIFNKTKRYLERKKYNDINSKLEIIKSVLDISDIEERYNYLYDLICDYLDMEFKSKNICDFNCGICVRRQAMKMKHIRKKTYLYGCCYSYIKRRKCSNLNKDGSCKVKNIGCKLFTCSYLKKRGYKYKLRNLYLSRYFFNFRQRVYMENTFFVSKDVIIKGILERC